MYIVEVIDKLLKKINEKKEIVIDENGNEIEEGTCEHIFAPTDSTGNILACTKCGLVVKKSKMMNKKMSK